MNGLTARQPLSRKPLKANSSLTSMKLQSPVKIKSQRPSARTTRPTATTGRWKSCFPSSSAANTDIYGWNRRVSCPCRWNGSMEATFPSCTPLSRTATSCATRMWWCGWIKRKRPYRRCRSSRTAACPSIRKSWIMMVGSSTRAGSGTSTHFSPNGFPISRSRNMSRSVPS